MTSSTDPIYLFKDTQVRNLIEVFSQDDPSSVILKLGQFEPAIRKFVAEQINGQQKATKKLPFLNKRNDIIFPPAISIEQCSSEATARHKASLVKGKSAVDLTSGFGIDAYFISKQFDKVELVEKNADLLLMSEHNFSALKVSNASFVQSSAEDFLANSNLKFDLIFIDPSRRAGSRKVFLPEDCEPDVVNLLPELQKRASTVMMKLSPMLDLQMIIRSFPGISELHIVSYQGECKEILLIFRENEEFQGKIICMDLDLGSFEFNIEEESSKQVDFGEPEDYLYLPNPSITKAGAFKSVAAHFKLKKMAENTHVYSSQDLIPSFPGKIHRSIGASSYTKEKLREISADKGFNIILRNFPDDLSKVSKKLGIQVNGDRYLICYTDHTGKPVLAVTEVVNAEPL